MILRQNYNISSACSSCSCWWCCSYSLFLRVCQESNCRTALSREDWGHNPYIPVDLENTTRGKLYDFCMPLQRTHKQEKAGFSTQRSRRHNFLRVAGRGIKASMVVKYGLCLTSLPRVLIHIHNHIQYISCRSEMLIWNAFSTQAPVSFSSLLRETPQLVLLSVSQHGFEPVAWKLRRRLVLKH